MIEIASWTMSEEHCDIRTLKLILYLVQKDVVNVLFSLYLEIGRQILGKILRSRQRIVKEHAQHSHDLLFYSELKFYRPRMENIATRNKIRASYCKCIYVCILYMVKKKVLTHN